MTLKMWEMCGELLQVRGLRGELMARWVLPWPLFSLQVPDQGSAPPSYYYYYYCIIMFYYTFYYITFSSYLLFIITVYLMVVFTIR